MNVLGPLLDLFRPQERAITPQQLFSTGLDELYSSESATGIRVTTDLAMQAAIGACVRLLADDISTLPVDVFRQVGKRKEEIEKPDWMARPSGRLWDTWTNHISDDVVSLGTDGNAFILAQPHFMALETLRVLDPEGIDILDGPQLRYRIEGGATLDETEVIHIPWVRLPGTLRGISPVAASKESIGLELAAREWASRFFGNGATVGGVIKHPGKPSKEELDELRKQFAIKHQGRRKSWAFGVLTGGAELVPTALKPAEADLEPLWRQVLEAACRIYHIPTHLVASQDPGAAARSSVEERGIAYVRHAVRPFVRRLEPIYSALIPGDDTFVRFNLNGLMQGNADARAQVYNLMLQGKTMTREEVRDLEDLPYDGDLGYLETPNNNSGATQ